MRVITLKNPVPLATPFTLVSTDYVTGTSLLVDDSSDFADNQLILIGGIGNEKTESTDLTATPPDQNTLTISSLSFPHNSDESVERIIWNQFDIDYNTGSGWVSLVAGQTFDWGKTETTYVHQTGSDFYSYRSRFKNSATGSYSDYSGTVVGSGLIRTQVGSMIKEVRNFSRDLNDQKASDQQIISYFNSCQDIVKLLNQKFDFLNLDYTFATVVSRNYYDLPDDCRRVYRLKYTVVTDNRNETYHLTYKTPTDFDPLYGNNNLADSDDLKDYTIDWTNRLIKVGPTPETIQSLELNIKQTLKTYLLILIKQLFLFPNY